MNASQRRKLEETERTLNKLLSRSQNGYPVIVEGRKDEEALRRLKVPGKILLLKATGSGFYDFVAGLAINREVTILTDFDKEGIRLASKLTEELSHMKVKVDLGIWKRFKALCRPEISTVEELASHIEGLRVKSKGN